MNLRIRFALLFSFFVFIILSISLVTIYLMYENFRKEEFALRVQNRVVEYADYFSRSNISSSNNLNSPLNIYTLTSESIIVYNKQFKKVYARPHTSSFLPSKNEITALAKQPFVNVQIGNRVGVVHHIKKNNTDFYIATFAYDRFGLRKIEHLKVIMLATLFGGLVLSGLFAFIFVKQIVKPLEHLTVQMQNISAGNLDKRVKISRGDNELTRIAFNFNAMLDRLENAFEMRKRFVQHASHELRTPLTNMLAQTEVAIEKMLSPEESNKVLRSLREDQQHLIQLTNSLLLLSKYEKLPQLTDLAIIRVDETLYEAIDTIKLLYPDSHITVNYTMFPENEQLLTVLGNEVLLMSALQNLVKNACHYADDNKVLININPGEDGMNITFDNNGQQLTEEEKRHLFIPFFRGENSIHKKGFGLGLSIVQRIINLHMGTVDYKAINTRINRFSIYFPRVKQ